MCITECITRVVLILFSACRSAFCCDYPSGSRSQSFSAENPRPLVIQVVYMFHVSVIEFSKGYLTFYILHFTSSWFSTRYLSILESEQASGLVVALAIIVLRHCNVSGQRLTARLPLIELRSLRSTRQLLRT